MLINFLKIFVGIVVLALYSCGAITSSVRKDFPVQKQITYEEAFEKGVKACRELNLEFELMNKDAGQIGCNTSYSHFKPYYELNIFLEKEKGLLKRFDVKASGYGETVPPSETEALRLIEQYFNALKRLGIE